MEKPSAEETTPTVDSGDEQAFEHEIDDEHDDGLAQDSDEDQEDEYDDEDEEELEEDVKNETIIKQGYLWKRSKNRMVWKKRWLVLRKSKLSMYKDEQEYKLLHIIKIANVPAQQVDRAKFKDKVFKLKTPERSYYFKAMTPDEMHTWIGAINAGLRIRSETASPPTVSLTKNAEQDVDDEDESFSPLPIHKTTEKLKSQTEHESTESDYDSDTGKINLEAMPKILPREGVIMSGYLRKQGHVRKKWKARWFVLRENGQLQYYEDDQEYEILDIIKLKDCEEIGRLEHPKKNFVFQIISPKRTLTVRADTEESLTAWLIALQTEFSKHREKTTDELRSD